MKQLGVERLGVDCQQKLVGCHDGEEGPLTAGGEYPPSRHYKIRFISYASRHHS
jgi:hypothetical protein